jgi:hypothetical protein
MKRFRNYIIKRGGRGLASAMRSLNRVNRAQGWEMGFWSGDGEGIRNRKSIFLWFISFGAIAKRNEQGKEILASLSISD